MTAPQSAAAGQTWLPALAAVALAPPGHTYPIIYLWNEKHKGDIVEDLLCTLQYRALSRTHLLVNARGLHKCNWSNEPLQELATLGWMVVWILKRYLFTSEPWSHFVKPTATPSSTGEPIQPWSSLDLCTQCSTVISQPLYIGQARSHRRLAVCGCALLSGQNRSMAGGWRLGRHVSHPKLALAAHHRRTAQHNTQSSSLESALIFPAGTPFRSTLIITAQ